VATLTGRNGLPCDTVHWVKEDDQHSLWLFTAWGLVRTHRIELTAWAAHAREDPTRRIQVDVLDAADGVRSVALAAQLSQLVAKTADGRLWFLPGDGVSVIDPRNVHVNTLAPSVHIERIILAATDGSLWLGTDKGLNRWKNGQVTIYRSAACGACAVAPRSAHLPPDGRRIHAGFGRLPTTDCRQIRWNPSLRTTAGRSGSRHRAGLPFSSPTGSFP
jgi:ligand-binding sensor domain-containing protein